jgi:FtsH-binding integral membrane protein
VSQLSEDHERRRRIILRRAALYTYGFLAAGLIVAIGGSALVAMLMARGGLPFLQTWLVITAIVLIPSLLGLVIRAVRAHRHSPTGRTARPNGEDTQTWPKTKR